MPFDPSIHHRQSIRLKNYDYSSPGGYFVTVVAYQRECLLGEILNCQVVLSKYGKVVKAAWMNLPRHFNDVHLDHGVIMPNHIHGILLFGLHENDVKNRPGLARVIEWFKFYSSKQINNARQSRGANVWQRNYYEHVIRDENDWQIIRDYIDLNPTRWDEDEENQP